MKLLKSISILSLVSLFNVQAMGQSRLTNKAIIGGDERALSNYPQVGRLSISRLSTSACTASLIGRTCMVSAGHCKEVMKYVDFNVPHSINGYMRYPHKVDQYKVDRKSIVSEFTFPTNPDWAVFRLKKHRPVSDWTLFWNRVLRPKKPIAQKYLDPEGYYAGDLQGFYQVSDAPVNFLEFIRVTGYGLDDRPQRNQSQQTALGFVQKIAPFTAPTTFFHDVDTRSGSSGAGIINEETQELIGVHTHQICPVSSNEEDHRIFCKNAGNSIHLIPAFAKAINDCLQWEKDNLD